MNKSLLLTIALLVAMLSGAGQIIPEFLMADTTVTDCDGILYDSGEQEQYGLNEDFTFTIESAVPVEVDFLNEFCVEIGFDALTIYDGPDTGAPVIGTYDGFDLPPSFTSTASVTFHFTSNENVSYCGFELIWNINAPEPVPPSISIPETECGSNTVPVQFSYPLGCEGIDPTTVVFSNELGTYDVNGVNSNCTADSSDFFEILLAQPVDVNCTYTLAFDMLVPDQCDSLWTFPVVQEIEYSGCNIQAELFADPETVCSNVCTNLTVEVFGCWEHTFDWSFGASGPGPHEVCPDESTTYTVVVTEVPTGNTLTLEVDVEVIAAEVLNAPETYCQSEGLLDLESNPEEGAWIGPGFLDDELGIWHPDSAGTGVQTIIFQPNEFCADTVVIDVIPIEVDSVIAACPDSGPFLLEGFPGGGTWAGDSTQSDGLFNPEIVGTYYPEYSVNGCTAVQIVNVSNVLATLPQSVYCQSEWADSLYVTPFGGVWSGPGIIIPEDGIFDPNEAGGGIHELYYEVEGCDQLYTAEVIPIDAGGFNTNSCPEQAPYIPDPDFSPSGGTWEGFGLSNTTTGEFDPGSVPNDTWTNLIYTAPNGCTDTIFMYVRQTEILYDPIYLCEDFDNVPLTWDYVGRTPGGGQWTGTGVINPDGNYFEFATWMAGVGDHQLIYSNNGCVDSMQMIVHPLELPEENVAICETSDAFPVSPDVPGGGFYSGTGISDGSTGTFDPLLSGPGSHEILWESPAGCSDVMYVNVEEDFPASISGLDSVYCWQDENIPVDISPSFGVISGPVTDGFFNPAAAGNGEHSIYVTYQGTLCSSEDSVNVLVLPAITASLTADDLLICPGQGVTLSVTADGGNPDEDLSVSWNEGLIPLETHTVVPDENTLYIAEVNDGCSDPQIDSVFIELLPPIQTNVTTSDTLCIGEIGWVTAEVTNTGTYALTWTEDDLETDTLFAGAGSGVLIHVEDLVEGCTYDTLALVPNYSPVSALFSPNPNADCIAFEANPITFLDLSQFGLSGTWEFGDGSSAPYEPGSNPEHVYDTPGEYEVFLQIENEGACLDSLTLGICILPPSAIFVPDIFSPNDDGANDILYVRGRGITQMSFVVYNRWGEAVFESNNPDEGWDGFHRGSAASSGVYTYVLKALVNEWATVEQSGNVTLIR